MRKYVFWLNLVFTLTIANFGRAEVLCPTCKSEDFFDFSGGLNTNVVPHKMNKQFSPYLNNVYTDEVAGQVTSANGYTVLGSTNVMPSVKFLFKFIPSTGAVQFLVSDGTAVYRTVDFSSWVLVRAGFNGTFELDAVQVRDKVWFTNGFDPVWTWSGSSAIILNGGIQATTTTPNVPIGKYIDFWLDRVWIANSTSSASRLQFSALSSTDITPVLLAPDHQYSWPGGNTINFLQGNGEDITGLWKYKNQLWLSKPSNIAGVFGTDETDFFLKDTKVADGFRSDRSLVVQDNVTYGLGRHNIYAFDGLNMIPVGDSIRPEIKAIVNATNRKSSLLYQSNNDFLLGAFGGIYSVNTTADPGGLKATDIVTVSSQGPETLQTQFINQGNKTSDFFTITSATVLSQQGLVTTTQTLTFTAVPKEIVIYTCCSLQSASIQIRNSNGNGTCRSSTISTTAEGLSYFTFTGVNICTVTFTKDDILTDKTQYAITNTNAVSFSSLTIGANGSHVLMRPTSSQYESFIGTANTITASWDQFLGKTIVSSETIQFRYRTGSSVANILTQPWLNISLGGLVNDTFVNRYVQWGASITTPAEVIGSRINLVEIQFGETGTPVGISAVSWLQRYWLSISTVVGVATRFTLVKQLGQTPTWTTLRGFNVNSLLRTEDILYGGSSQSGAVHRLDFGSDLNGATLRPGIQTTETVMEAPFLMKNVKKAYFDLNGNRGDVINFDVYADTKTVTTYSLTLNTTGRNLISLNNVNTSGNRFKFDISAPNIGTALRLNTLSIIYEPTQRDKFQ